MRPEHVVRAEDAKKSAHALRCFTVPREIIENKFRSTSGSCPGAIGCRGQSKVRAELLSPRMIGHGQHSKQHKHNGAKYQLVHGCSPYAGFKRFACVVGIAERKIWIFAVSLVL